MGTRDSGDSKANRKFSWPHLVVGLAMVAASGAGVGFTPNRHMTAAASIDLEGVVPREFSGWREITTPMVQMDLAPRDGETSMDQPYDRTLMRTYARGDGSIVMLALAWGRSQRQEVKIHRPELCYVAQGFEVKNKQAVSVDFGGGHRVNAYRLLTRNEQRLEPITYWIRIGDDIAMNAWQSRMLIFREGLKGQIPDGMLVRVSQAVPPGQDVRDRYAVEEQFLRDLVGSLDPVGKRLLIGQPH